jgi:hypothetical protein
LRVTPASASSGVIRNSVQAMFMLNSSDDIGDEPGLQSVATAMATPVLAESGDRRAHGFSQACKTRPAECTATVPAPAIAAASAAVADTRHDPPTAQCISRRQLRSTEIGELLGMQLDRQAQRLRACRRPRQSDRD